MVSVADIGSLLSGVGALGGLFGGGSNLKDADRMRAQNFEDQKYILQNQVQWRAADAKAAGLHPLATLGLSPASAPVGVLGDKGPSLGDRLSTAGQSIGRAVAALQSREEREFSRASQALQLEEQKARIRLLNSQATNVSQSRSGGEKW